MIYEMRTYDLKPRALPEVEQRFGEAYKNARSTSSSPRSGTPRSVRSIRLSTSGATRTWRSEIGSVKLP